MGTNITFTAMTGHIEERARLPGEMKLASDGLTPKWLVMFGDEKSSISLFRTIPSSVISLDPK